VSHEANYYNSYSHVAAMCEQDLSVKAVQSACTPDL